MEKIELQKVDKTIYREVLDNGLEIIIIPNEEYSKKKNYYFNYGTYYGALNNDFVPIGKNKMTSFPSGIAHFLEHKMFEQESGEDPFQYFSQSEKRAQNVRSISALFPLNRRSVSLQSAQYSGGKHCAD